MAHDYQNAAHQLTRQWFSSWSDRYERSILQWLLFGPSHRMIIQRLRDRFGDHPLTILDVGGGTGLFADLIRSALPRAKVWVLDFVAGMLVKGTDRWGRHAGYVMPVQGDSELLPFASGVFDVVTCANSFHHYPHQDRAVVEMHRVLRPGGALMIIDGYRDNLWGWFFYDVCVAGLEKAVHHASARRLRELFSQAGFSEIVQIVRNGPIPFLLTEATHH